MMTDREIMQQALRWADQHGEAVFAGGGMDAVEAMNEWAQALRSRLAQPEQEPVAWESFFKRYCPWLAQPEQEPVALESIYETIIQWDEGGGKRSRRELARRIVALYTTPPKRQWVGLTDEEEERLIHNFGSDPHTLLDEVNARLKKRNT